MTEGGRRIWRRNGQASGELRCGKIDNMRRRNADDGRLEAIDKAREISQKAGCSLETAHLKPANPTNWQKIDATLKRMKRADRFGQIINADGYFYIAYSPEL